jgi:hypothetical protein
MGKVIFKEQRGATSRSNCCGNIRMLLVCLLAFGLLSCGSNGKRHKVGAARVRIDALKNAIAVYNLRSGRLPLIPAMQTNDCSVDVSDLVALLSSPTNACSQSLVSSKGASGFVGGFLIERAADPC